MEFRTEAFRVANRPSAKTKLFNYIRAKHIKRIFERFLALTAVEEEEEEEHCVSSSSPLFLSFFRVLPANSIRSEFVEGKLINYESYFPIQWIDRAFGRLRASKPSSIPTSFGRDFLPPPSLSLSLFLSLSVSFVPIIYRRAWERIQCCRPTGKLQVFSLRREFRAEFEPHLPAAKWVTTVFFTHLPAV